MADAVKNPASAPVAALGVAAPKSDSAERAYAAAAESAIAKADAVATPPVAAPAIEAAKDAPAPLEFPAKVKRESAPKTEVKVEAPVAATPAAPAPVVAPVTAAPAAPVAKAKPVPAPKAVAVKKPAPAKKSVAVKKPVAAKKLVVAAKPAAPAKPISTPAIKLNRIQNLKDTIMATKTTDFTKTIKTAAADVQAKAKLALAKGSAVASEVSDFTKGNVDAVVASGKILAAGVQDLSKGYVAEGKSAYETLTGDVKELKAVKSPSDFIKVQTTIARRNMDHAFDLGAKNSEAVLKLATDTFAPISTRLSLAVAKFKKAA